MNIKKKDVKLWWQLLADQHRKEREKIRSYTRCACGGCLKAREEGYKG